MGWRSVKTQVRQAEFGQTQSMDEESDQSERTLDERMRITIEVVERARDAAQDVLGDDLHKVAHTRAALGGLEYAATYGEELPSEVVSVLAMGQQGAEIVRGVIDTLNARLDGYPVPNNPMDDDDSYDDSYVGDSPYDAADDDWAIESADDALRRQSQGEIINEILAGGAVAASFTAVASVAKAKIEATTQREKNKQDTETERLRIASQERIAGVQAASGQLSTADTDDTVDDNGA